MARLFARSKSNMDLKYFTILAAYYCDIIQNKVLGGFRIRQCVRKPCVRFFITMDDIQQTYIRKKSLTNICHARARKINFMSSLARFGSNIMTEK